MPNQYRTWDVSRSFFSALSRPTFIINVTYAWKAKFIFIAELNYNVCEEESYSIGDDPPFHSLYTTNIHIHIYCHFNF